MPKIIEIGKYLLKLQLKMSEVFFETHCRLHNCCIHVILLLLEFRDTGIQIALNCSSRPIFHLRMHQTGWLPALRTSGPQVGFKGWASGTAGPD